MNEILNFSALELSRAIRKGEICVPEAVEAALVVSAPGVYITRTEEQAMQRARELQKRVKGAQSPLFGVPMALKDNICTAGVRTTCGSNMLREFCSPYDATAAERLREAGAVCLGKTNMDEFGMGSTCETSAFGPVANPWSEERVAGGSSGGSGAAVARGACWFALGSDTGGSVRLPAAYCGVTGIKPTYGTVSRYGLVAYASSFDQIGPLCRDAADCAAVLDAIMGHDRRDSTSLPGDYGHLLDKLSGDIRGMRVGLPTRCFEEGLAPEAANCVLEAAQVLRQRGAVVEPCTLPDMDRALSAYYIMACAQAGSNLARYDGIRYGRRAQEYDSQEQLYERSRAQGFGAEVKRRILLGTFVLSAGYYDAYYKKAVQVRQRISAEFAALFERYDLLLMPVAPGPAPKLGESLDDPAGMYAGDLYTVSANLAGLPALSMPCGFDCNGLPVGAQLMGAVLAEDKVLNAAHAYQLETDFHLRRPACFGKGGGEG